MNGFNIKTPYSSRRIGDNAPTFVIAEIGKNFIQTKKEKSVKEYLRNAKELVILAKKSGADAVKFQTHNVEDEQLNLKIRAPHFKGDRYEWVSRNTKATPVKEFWIPLKEFCDKEGITFFSTPCSLGAAKILSSLDVALWKVASWDILDFVMLDHIRKSGKPVIISGGASTAEEIDRSISYIQEKNKNLALLHCVSKYPCPPEELNLGTIGFFKKRYDVPIGFSDHSLGIESTLAAVALGAKVIEKHFSLSRSLWGADHRFSMTSASFGKMVTEIRKIEANPGAAQKYLNHEKVKPSLNFSGKVIRDEEKSMKAVFAKALFAGRDIPAGQVIKSDMIYSIRPGLAVGGLQPLHFHMVVGQKSAKDLKKFEPITLEVVKSE